MLKRIIIRLKPVFFVILLPFSAQAYLSTENSGPFADAYGLLGPAQDWSWTGKLRLQGDLALYQKPSSLEGQASSDWGSLEFANLWVNESAPFSVGLAGRFAPDRDVNTSQPVFEWEEARVTWTHNPEVSFGVVVDPIVAFDSREWRETSLGKDFRPGVDKWKLIPHADLGLQVMQKTEWGNWTFQVTNGEGWPKTEKGVRKDFELVWEKAFVLSDRDFRTQLFYRKGSYDQLAADNDLKQRYGGQIAYVSPMWNIGLIGLMAEDAVDGITGVEGEGVNLLTKGGQRVKNSLSEFWVRYVAGDSPRKWRLLMRSGLFRPDNDDSKKDVSSLVFGGGTDLAAGMQLNLLLQQTIFGPTHSGTDRQKWFLAWVWGIERTPAPLPQ